MTSPNDRPDTPPIPPSAAEPAAYVPPPVPPPVAPTPPAPITSSPPSPGADFKATLEQGARTLDQRAEAFGREAEAAAKRWGENPAVRETADLAGRLWGLVLLGFGLWFFADVTLRLDLPNVRWSELWPVLLIVLGGFVVIRGLARRS